MSDNRKHCSRCSLDLPNEAIFANHENWHKSEDLHRSFTCELCLQVLRWELHLEGHVKKDHQHDAYKCDICDKLFGRLKDLAKHGQQVVRCDTCDLVTCDSQEFSFHPCKRVSQTKFPLSYTCQVCKLGFAKKSGLVRHVKRRHQSNGIKCDSCDARFGRSIDMTRHKYKEHDGMVLFECVKCDFVASHKSVYAKHHCKLPKPLKTLRCDICDHRFSRNTYLMSHIKRKHQTFKCDKCEGSYVTEEDLTCHIRAEHPEFKCDKCDKKFASSKDLATHRKSSHLSTFKCKYCGLILKDQIAFIIHRCDKGQKCGKQSIFVENDRKSVISFKCDTCNCYFVHQDKFDIHTCQSGQIEAQNNGTSSNKLIETLNEKRTSDKCDKVFDPVEGTDHHKQLYPKSIIRCFRCNYVTNNQALFASHVCIERKKSESHIVTYADCDKKVDVTMARIEEVNRFICELCRLRFRCKTELSTHVLIYHREDGIKCDKCHKLFGRKLDLFRHMLSHQDQVVHECKHCDFVTTEEKLFANHECVLKRRKKMLKPAHCDGCHKPLLVTHKDSLCSDCFSPSIKVFKNSVKCDTCNCYFVHKDKFVNHPCQLGQIDSQKSGSVNEKPQVTIEIESSETSDKNESSHDKPNVTIDTGKNEAIIEGGMKQEPETDIDESDLKNSAYYDVTVEQCDIEEMSLFKEEQPEMA